MVTHDVGLKYFADRIIWLRDGKIQRIEHVSLVKKKETMDKLNHDLARLNIKFTEEQEGEGPKEYHGFKNTDIRQPTDYQTHRDYNASKFIFLIFPSS